LWENNGERLRTLSGGVGVTGLTVGDVDASPHNAGGLHVKPSGNEKIVLSNSTDPYIRWQEGTTDRFYIQWRSSEDAPLFRNQQGDHFDFMPHASTGAVSLRLRGTDNDTWGFVYATDSQEVGFLDEGGSWAYRHANNSLHEWRINNTVEMSLSTSTLDMKGNTITEVEDIGLRDRIYHDGDTNNYMQFHATDQWRVVVAGTERLEVKNSSPHVLVTGTLQATLRNSDVRNAFKSSTYNNTGTYIAGRCLSGNARTPNSNIGGGSLAACDFNGRPYRSGNAVYTLGGSWKCHGYTDSPGSLNTSNAPNDASLFIRYA
jgi:hypothetical protein